MAAFLLLIAAAPAAAQEDVNSDQVTAEQAIQNHQRQLDAQLGLKCSGPLDGEEIVVCGRRGGGDGPGGSKFRVPYAPEAGRRIPGEARYDGGGCIRLCSQPVMIPLVGKGNVVEPIVRGIKRLLED